MVSFIVMVIWGFLVITGIVSIVYEFYSLTYEKKDDGNKM